MRLKPVLCLALAGLALPLAACEDKKTFKHDAEWAAPSKTPRAAHTDTPQGTAEAIGDRLDDILDATRSVNGLADTARATTRMRTAYADIETYYARLKSQEPKADGPNRIAVARYFFKGQQELAKSVADLFEQDPKIVEVISAELGAMKLVQDPPDALPADEIPGAGIDKEIPVPEIDNPKPKGGTKPKAK